MKRTWKSWRFINIELICWYGSSDLNAKKLINVIMKVVDISKYYENLQTFLFYHDLFICAVEFRNFQFDPKHDNFFLLSMYISWPDIS